MTSWKKVLEVRSCQSCGEEFQPYNRKQVACSRTCFNALPDLVEDRLKRRREADKKRAAKPGEREKRNAANRVSVHPHRRLIHLKSNLKRTYGLTYEDYQDLVRTQDGKCAICGDPPDPNGRGAYSRLQVDHHHGSGKVRALLCAPCNKGLGHFNEDPARLAKALEYLRAHTD